jgi:putative DNA primase/helicase
VGAHGIGVTQESVGGLVSPQLVIPFYAVDKTLHTLQLIDINGDKRWLLDGAKQGHYYRLTGKSDRLFIAEGFATAASI